MTEPVWKGGLGFDYKWDLGWMHDTLEYFQTGPEYRSRDYHKLTFSMVYFWNERYMLEYCHDEVVHGKGSLVNKMWGDYWNKFAGLRLYLAHMMGHPGKKLMFMGSEYGQFTEWHEYEELQWNLTEENDMHKKTQLFFKDMNHYYKDNKALWENDYEPEGYEWIDADNCDESIFSFY